MSVVNGYDLEHAEQAIAAGDADAVSMIRSIYADTRCVRKAATGREAQIRPCVRCNTCIGRTHSYMLEVRCAVNPVLGRETHLQSATGAAGTRIAYRKRILVAGGGPAGMEAARIAADLGHEVTLVEQADHLGGKFELAAALKPELARYLQWSVSSTLNDPRITVELETPVTPELVAERQPDALLLAFARGRQARA